jgi:hypothetical protein
MNDASNWIKATAALSAVTLCIGTFVDCASARPRQSCSSLRGKHLVSNHKIKVVQQGNQFKAIAYVCVPPNGPVRAAGAASSPLGNSEYSISVAALAGPWVALSFDSVDGLSGNEIGKTTNAPSGRSYRYWESELGPIEPQEVHALETTQLNASGQMALAVHAKGLTQIIGVESSGKRLPLDSAPWALIPPASLTLKGATVQWVDAGSARTATI